MNLARFKTYAVLIPAVLALAACQQHKDAPGEAQAGTGPDAKPGITVSDGVLTLPVIKGNPGAAYFTLTNHGPATAVLAAVDVDGAAKAEMHDSQGGSMAPIVQLPVNAGQSVKFAPGGKHVMAFELNGKLAAGGTTEMTLTFADGDKISTSLKITATGGDAMADMPGMAMGSGHP